MATTVGCPWDLFNSDAVHYKCSCSSYWKLSKLYFCKHCLEIRCGNCVSHEVDSFFCPNCEENIPSTEAKYKKYQCMNCWVCPCCRHTLIPRAVGIQVPAPDDPTKTIPKKVYFLTCVFCRCTSRDAGIPDQTTVSGGWQELEDVHSDRITELVDYYKAITLREKYEKEKKSARKTKFLHLISKSSSYSVPSRRSFSSIAGFRDKEVEIKNIVPAVASDEVEELPPNYLEEPCLTSITSIQQRHNDSQFQPDLTSKMYPHRMSLIIKQSKRCKVCEHNLIKPEFNPTSIKFKIRFSAYYHIPEIRVMKLPELVYQQSSKLILTLRNPTQHDLAITIIGIKSTEDSEVTADIEAPAEEMKLSQHDDTAEFDDMSDNCNFKDDPEVITYRKANKIGFCCTITPQVKFGELKAKLLMKYNNIVTTIVLPQNEPKEPQIVSMELPVILNLGLISA